MAHHEASEISCSTNLGLFKPFSQRFLRSSPAEGQQCLDQWLLQRAPVLEDCQVNDARGDCQPLDPKHPERWQLDLNVKRPGF